MRVVTGWGSDGSWGMWVYFEGGATDFLWIG